MKLEHIGIGGDATHVKHFDIFSTEIDQTQQETFTFNPDVKIDPDLAKQFRYKFSYTNKALTKLKQLLSIN